MGLWEGVSVAAHFLSLGCLLRLLLRREGIDLLPCADEAAVVLLLELGSNVVKGHERRSTFEVGVELLDKCR